MVTNLNAAATYSSRVRACIIAGAIVDLHQGWATARSCCKIHSNSHDVENHLSHHSHLFLMTVDGLVEALEWANSGVGADETAIMWLAYLRWLGAYSQIPTNAPPAQIRAIDTLLAPHLFAEKPQRCTITRSSFDALSIGTMGTLGRALNTDSTDSGALIRAAAFGLIPYLAVDSARIMSINSAALTHGNPEIHHDCAMMTGLIRALLEGGDLIESLETITADQQAGDTLNTVLETLKKPALSINPQVHWRDALDSLTDIEDSSERLAGRILISQILGAYYGLECFPEFYSEENFTNTGCSVSTSLAVAGTLISQCVEN